MMREKKQFYLGNRIQSREHPWWGFRIRWPVGLGWLFLSCFLFFSALTQAQEKISFQEWKGALFRYCELYEQWDREGYLPSSFSNEAMLNQWGASLVEESIKQVGKDPKALNALLLWLGGVYLEHPEKQKGVNQLLLQFEKHTRSQRARDEEQHFLFDWVHGILFAAIGASLFKMAYRFLKKMSSCEAFFLKGNRRRSRGPFRGGRREVSVAFGKDAPPMIGKKEGLWIASLGTLLGVGLWVREKNKTKVMNPLLYVKALKELFLKAKKAQVKQLERAFPAWEKKLSQLKKMKGNRSFKNAKLKFFLKEFILKFQKNIEKNRLEMEHFFKSPSSQKFLSWKVSFLELFQKCDQRSEVFLGGVLKKFPQASDFLWKIEAELVQKEREKRAEKKQYIEHLRYYQHQLKTLEKDLNSLRKAPLLREELPFLNRRLQRLRSFLSKTRK